MKILIADDHSVVRRGLREIIMDSHLKAAIDEAGSGQEVINKVREKNYDLVLLDISMPGMNGIEVLKQIKKKRRDVRVLILTMHTEEQYAIRALKAGADGYLAKSGSPDDLIFCIRKILKGNKCVSPSLAEGMACFIGDGKPRHSHELLSNREFEVMRMIASGKKIKDVADELSVSVKTISTYRSRILEKMNMDNFSQVIRYSIENQLV